MRTETTLVGAAVCLTSVVLCGAAAEAREPMALAMLSVGWLWILGGFIVASWLDAL